MSSTDWYQSRAHDGRCGFVDPSGVLPDGEFNTRTLRLAELLTTRFPERPVHIGLWGENSLDYLVALFAILRAGHVAVPLSTRFTTARTEGRLPRGRTCVACWYRATTPTTTAIR